MRILAIIMILTLSSCMVSQKTFDSKCADLQNQIDGKVERFEFQTKDELLRGAIKNCCKTKENPIAPHDPANK
tara:strand:+ start:193 stop:411 length:219 start_codon:yes stop_codon:yes gene_type:complete